MSPFQAGEKRTYEDAFNDEDLDIERFMSELDENILRCGGVVPVCEDAVPGSAVERLDSGLGCCGVGDDSSVCYIV